MRCPGLSALPPPPPGKTGWPWTEECLQLPDVLPDGRLWPRISIVTPNYNYGHFIEETIRSVLLQGYPDLEYIVMDGGSTDGSAEIIRKYARWLTHWVSEPDRGQAHAINKGFARASGDLLAWINSDDFYLPSALRLFGEAHARRPEAILAGDVENFDDGGSSPILIRQSNLILRNLLDPWNGKWVFHQPGVFVPRSVSVTAGPLDEGLRYAFDHDWLCRLLQHASATYLGVPVARFRIHTASKTGAERPAALPELLHVVQRYWDLFPDIDKPCLRAVHGMREAAVYLSDHPAYIRYWNRRTAMRHLYSTWLEYPRVVLSSEFLKLCMRLVLPRWALQFRRAVKSEWGYKNHEGVS